MGYVVRDSELSGRPFVYLWDICKRFGAEFYHTWRWELSTSLLIAIVVYALTFNDDRQAWKNLVITIQATAYVLALFGVWHIIRTPFLVHCETVKGNRVSDHWGFGILGIVALAAMSYGSYYAAHTAIRHYLPDVALTIPSADVGARNAEIKELQEKIVYMTKHSLGAVNAPVGEQSLKQRTLLWIQGVSRLYAERGAKWENDSKLIYQSDEYLKAAAQPITKARERDTFAVVQGKQNAFDQETERLFWQQ